MAPGLFLFIEPGGCCRSSSTPALGGVRFVTALALRCFGKCLWVLAHVTCSLGGFQVTPCSSYHPLRLLLSNKKKWEKREPFSFRIPASSAVSQHPSLCEFPPATALMRRHRRKNCTTPSDLGVGNAAALFKPACHSTHFCSTGFLNARLPKYFCFCSTSFSPKITCEGLLTFPALLGEKQEVLLLLLTVTSRYTLYCFEPVM